MHTLAQNLMGYANLHLLPVSTDSTCLLILCTHTYYIATQQPPTTSHESVKKANEMRHLPVPQSEPIRSLAGFRSVLHAPKCVPDINSHIKQIVFTMFDNGAYDLFYIYVF